jgi:hypothetical protein
MFSETQSIAALKDYLRVKVTVKQIGGQSLGAIRTRTFLGKTAELFSSKLPSVMSESALLSKFSVLVYFGSLPYSKFVEVAESIKIPVETMVDAHETARFAHKRAAASLNSDQMKTAAIFGLNAFENLKPKIPTIPLTPTLDNHPANV